MANGSFQPWVGEHYDETRLLLLRDPLSDHPTTLVENILANFDDADDGDPMKRLSRGLAGDREPSEERRYHVWHRVAFTYCVDEETFRNDILKEFGPRRIIASQMASNAMPDADVHMTDDVQGYLLDDGSVAVCFALSDAGWARLADTIHFALGRELPRSGPSCRFPGDGE